jgi:dTDP-4-amino-4,6-dideoxygalactose transaminase
LAVELALRACGVGAGDEVLLAAYDYEGNFLSVHAVGAVPVLVDVTASSWQLDPEQLAAAASPRTKAVICSHLHGGIVDMPAVLALARQQGWFVIEDAAQAVGGQLHGRRLGSWGDVGVLSFGGSKLLCAGRGGALLCHDPRLAQRLRLLLRRGPQEWAALSELQAAVLRPQVAELPARTARRATHVALLHEALSRFPGLRLLAPPATDQTLPAFYKVGWDYDAAAFGLSRDHFLAALQAEGIAVAPGFRALHLHRSPSRYRTASPLPQATQAHHRCILLHHPVLIGHPDDVLQIPQAIAKVYRHRQSLAALPLTPSRPLGNE